MLILYKYALWSQKEWLCIGFATSIRNIIVNLFHVTHFWEKQYILVFLAVYVYCGFLIGSPQTLRFNKASKYFKIYKLLFNVFSISRDTLRVVSFTSKRLLILVKTSKHLLRIIYFWSQRDSSVVRILAAWPREWHYYRMQPCQSRCVTGYGI